MRAMRRACVPLLLCGACAAASGARAAWEVRPVRSVGPVTHLCVPCHAVTRRCAQPAARDSRLPLLLMRHVPTARARPAVARQAGGYQAAEKSKKMLPVRPCRAARQSRLALL